MFPNFLNSIFPDGSTGLTAQQVLALKTYRVLFIPGFLTDRKPQFFRAQMAVLISLGLKVNVDFEVFTHSSSNDPPELRGAVLAERIRYVRDNHDPRRLIVISHSKGSIDFLESLLHFPDVLEQTEIWISIQGLFGGSPITELTRNKFIRSLYKSETHQHFSESFRKTYMQGHAKEFSIINNKVKVLSVVGQQDKKNMSRFVRLFISIPSARVFKDQRNDGIVPLENQIFPESECLLIQSDHLQLVYDFKSAPCGKIWNLDSPKPINPEKITKSLLSMVLPKIDLSKAASPMAKAPSNDSIGIDHGAQILDLSSDRIKST